MLLIFDLFRPLYSRDLVILCKIMHREGTKILLCLGHQKVIRRPWLWQPCILLNLISKYSISRQSFILEKLFVQVMKYDRTHKKNAGAHKPFSIRFSRENYNVTQKYASWFYLNVSLFSDWNPLICHFSKSSCLNV